MYFNGFSYVCLYSAPNSFLKCVWKFLEIVLNRISPYCIVSKVKRIQKFHLYRHLTTVKNKTKPSIHRPVPVRNTFQVFVNTFLEYFYSYDSNILVLNTKCTRSSFYSFFLFIATHRSAMRIPIVIIIRISLLNIKYWNTIKPNLNSEPILKVKRI